MEKQRTINKSVSFSGIGLHTGNPSTVTFHPAPENHGYKFIRTDIDKKVEVPALVEYVVDLVRSQNQHALTSRFSQRVASLRFHSLSPN